MYILLRMVYLKPHLYSLTPATEISLLYCWIRAERTGPLYSLTVGQKTGILYSLTPGDDGSGHGVRRLPC